MGKLATLCEKPLVVVCEHQRRVSDCGVYALTFLGTKGAFRRRGRQAKYSKYPEGSHKC